MKYYAASQAIDGATRLVVIATHDDTQDVPSSAYGPGVTIVHAAQPLALERVGAAPAAGAPDLRPLALPPMSPAERAAPLWLYPATFFCALRVALQYSATLTAAELPKDAEITKDWLLERLRQPAVVTGLQSALGVTADVATMTRQMILDRLAGSTKILRGDPAMDAFAALLGLTSAQVDAVFIAAKGAATDMEIATDTAAALAALQS